MRVHSTQQSVTEIKPALPSTKSAKIRKHIAKLEVRQLKLNAEQEKAAKELADADRSEAIEIGRTEFIGTVEGLDPTTREMVISAVLETLKDESRMTRVQTWMAAILEREPQIDSSHRDGKAEVSSEKESAPAADRPKIPSTKPESSASVSVPTE